jgi:hypothetical protein
LRGGAGCCCLIMDPWPRTSLLTTGMVNQRMQAATCKAFKGVRAQVVPEGRGVGYGKTSYIVPAWVGGRAGGGGVGLFKDTLREFTGRDSRLGEPNHPKTCQHT